MSQPIRGSEDPINGAMCEIVRAMSSLNMHADPLPLAKIEEISKENGGIAYLSQTDRWAMHSMEHLKAAFDELRRIEGLWLTVETAVRNLREIEGLPDSSPIRANSIKRVLGILEIALSKAARGADATSRDS